MNNKWNRIAFITGVLLIILSIFMLIRMNQMNKELDILNEREAQLIEEISLYQK